MGSLSNLYISQSYQSLIHLGTNNTASANLIELQDGLGNSIGVAVNTNGDLFLSGSLTASLQQGYLYVGGANGKTTAFATSSLVTNINTGSLVTTSSFNSYTQSTNIRLDNLEINSASVNVSISNLNSTTASQGISITNLNASSASQQISIDALNQNSASVNTSVNNINTFTQSAQISINSINAASSSWITESETASFARTNVDNNFTANQTFTNITAESASIRYLTTLYETASVIYSSGSNQLGDELTDIQTLSGSVKVQGSLTVNGTPVQTSSFDATALNQATASLQQFTQSAQISINALNTNSASVNTSISALNTFTASQSTASLVTSITNINSATASLFGSASLGLTTASFDNGTRNLTFTKGDTQTFSVNIPDVSGSASLPAGVISGSAQITALGFVSSSVTASSLVTASFSGNTLTFTKGDASTFGVVIPDVSGSAGNFVTTSSFNAYTQSNDQRVSSLETNSASVNISISNINTFTQSANISINALNAATSSYATSAITASSLITASVSLNTITFTKGDGTTFPITVNTGSGGTTYINPTLNPYSGSLILVANTFTSSSFAHISASANGQVNLIFKFNDFTGETIISGSGNIFGNQQAAGAGFKRYIGGSNNIINSLTIPTISSSMAFSPTMTSNLIPGIITARGPVSSSAWTLSTNVIPGTLNIGASAILNAEKLTSGLTFTGNSVAGTLTIIANQTALTSSITSITNNNIIGGVTLTLSSSAQTFSNNIVNDNNFILTTQFSSGSLGLGSAFANLNTIGGSTNTFYITGSQLVSGTGPSFNQNFVFGSTNTLFVNASNARVSGSIAYQNSLATGLMGQRLIASGSSNATDLNSFGSVFVGRWNANDGIRNKTSDVVFAVGTGISGSGTTGRKTGFLIDSGSNSFFEGSLTVSGSTTLSGSLYIQSGSTLPAETGSSVLTWNQLTGQVAQSPLANVLANTFSLGVFTSTITQSGSAAVSQSMTFNNTEESSGVTLSNDSRLNVATSGYYNIQFSAQLLADTGADDVWIWLKKNGTNVPNTGTRVTLANNEEIVAAWNFVVNATAGDYYELVWQNADGHAELLTEPASGNYPVIPSVIVTVTQVR